MDAELAREYRARWRAVAEIEDSELREATVAERWQKLNAILRMALELGLPLQSDEEDEIEVWQRWAKLKAACE